MGVGKSGPTLLKSDQAVKITKEAEDRLQEVIRRYPNSKSAIMPALYIAQELWGSVTEEAALWVSERLNLPVAHVTEVATFYTMYYKRPVGKYHVQVCRTLSCMICGARDLTGYLRKRLALKPGEVSADGMWSYEEVECLGSCGTAPMVEINDVFFENLTPEKLGALMDRIEKEKPDLRYSGIREELGAGLSGLPKSEAWTKA